MANESVLVNGVDLQSALGFKIRQIRGLLHGPEQRFNTGPLAGRDGEELLASADLRTTQPRIVTLSGDLDAASASALVTVADALKNYLYQGALTVKSAHDLNRELIAYCTAFESDAYNPTFVARTAPTVATLTAFAPLWRATSDTTTAFTTDTSIPIGTARVRPRIVITVSSGTVTGFTVTLKDASGNTITTTVIGNGGTALSLASTNTFTIDSDLMRLRKNVGAGEVDASMHHVSGAFPILDPRYVTLAGPTYMTLSVGSVTGGGSVTASAIYRKTYY
jgi:hypothetical protein